MDKKYELIKSGMRGLYRIKALRDFGNIKEGDIGGYVENKHNLSHAGDCWIYNNAKVYNNAKIYDNAKVYNNAKIYDNAKIYNNAEIFEYTEVFDDAVIQGNALAYGVSVIEKNALIYGTSSICGNARIGGNAKIKKGMHIGKINEKFKDILYIQCENRLITVYRDMNNIIKCNIGCQSKMTLEGLLKRIEKDGGMTKDREEYVRIMENAHLLLGWEKRGVKRWKVFDELEMYDKTNENADNTSVRCFGILENIKKMFK